MEFRIFAPFWTCTPRNKMEFSVGDEVKDGPLTLGLHKRGSFYDIVSVPDCQIIDEDLRKVLKTTQDFFRNAKLGGKSIDFYHKMRHEGVLRHLLVRKGLKTGSCDIFSGRNRFCGRETVTWEI